MHESRTEQPGAVLFLEKVFMRPVRSEPRGVEVFNLNLIRDLAGLGHRVTVVAHGSWAPVLASWAGRPDGAIAVVALPASLGTVAGSVAALLRFRGQRFSHLLMGNVGDRLIPALWAVRLLRLASRCVLIAHREPSVRYVRAQAVVPTDVVAVNGQIAGHFPSSRFRSVTVFYGITGADRFLNAVRRPAADGAVEFCMLGDLDRAWKGADTAVEAFGLLPAEVRGRCRLHLASFACPAASDNARIRSYTWMPFADVPGFLAGMDVMLVPSRDEGVMRETFSQAAVQGMLVGLPLIVSRLPVLEEKVADGGGLVYGSTAGELARAMQQLAGDPALRAGMGRAAREAARSRYVWDTAEFVRRFMRAGRGSEA